MPAPGRPPVILPVRQGSPDRPRSALSTSRAAPGRAGRPAQAVTQGPRALECTDRRPTRKACRSNLPPVGSTSPPQQDGGSSAGVTQPLGLCLGHRHQLSLLGDFQRKAATRWRPTTATNIRRKGLGTSVPVSGTSSEGVLESRQDMPHRPGRPARASPPNTHTPSELQEPPPVCPAALENPAGTRAVSDCKTETTKRLGENGTIIALIPPSRCQRKGDAGKRDSERPIDKESLGHAPIPKREHQDYRGRCSNLI